MYRHYVKAAAAAVGLALPQTHFFADIYNKYKPMSAEPWEENPLWFRSRPRRVLVDMDTFNDKRINLGPDEAIRARFNASPVRSALWVMRQRCPFFSSYFSEVVHPFAEHRVSANACNCPYYEWRKKLESIDFGGAYITAAGHAPDFAWYLLGYVAPGPVSILFFEPAYGAYATLSDLRTHGRFVFQRELEVDRTTWKTLPDWRPKYPESKEYLVVVTDKRDAVTDDKLAEYTRHIPGDCNVIVSGIDARDAIYTVPAGSNLTLVTVKDSSKIPNQMLPFMVGVALAGWGSEMNKVCVLEKEKDKLEYKAVPLLQREHQE